MSSLIKAAFLKVRCPDFTDGNFAYAQLRSPSTDKHIEMRQTVSFTVVARWTCSVRSGGVRPCVPILLGTDVYMEPAIACPT
jgi:hypothetical protein